MLNNESTQNSRNPNSSKGFQYVKFENSKGFAGGYDAPLTNQEFGDSKGFQ